MSSNNQLYNQEPIDNNTVVCTSKYIKRLDLMLSVLITHTQRNIKKKGNVWRWQICLVPWLSSPTTIPQRLLNFPMMQQLQHQEAPGHGSVSVLFWRSPLHPFQLRTDCWELGCPGGASGKEPACLIQAKRHKFNQVLREVGNRTATTGTNIYVLLK